MWEPYSIKSLLLLCKCILSLLEEITTAFFTSSYLDINSFILSSAYRWSCRNADLRYSLYIMWLWNVLENDCSFSDVVWSWYRRNCSQEKSRFQVSVIVTQYWKKPLAGMIYWLALTEFKLLTGLFWAEYKRTSLSPELVGCFSCLIFFSDTSGLLHLRSRTAICFRCDLGSSLWTAKYHNL